MAFDPIPYITKSNVEIVLDQVFDILTFESVNQLEQGELLARAQGTLTLDVAVTDGDQFIVGGKTYTLEAILSNFDGNIAIGADLAATKLNIVAAFDLNGVAGTDYALAMTANTDVDIAAFSNNNSILTAKLSGTDGNSIATTSTFAAGTNKFDAVTLGTTRAGFVYNESADNFSVVKELHTRIDVCDFFKDPNNLDKTLVNLYFNSADTDPKTQKRDKRYKPDYFIDCYAKRPTDDDDEGLTKAALKVTRTIMQISKILYDPRYERLGIAYRDANDPNNLIQFIEKRSITSLEKFPPEDSAEAVENIIPARVILHVQLNEQQSDINGNPLEIVFSQVEAETQ